MKFTKEEINLCKQVSERHRKEIKEGDWIKYNYGKPMILLASKCCINTHLKFTDEKHYFPLWTISDCLEFLREKGYRLKSHYDMADEVWITFSMDEKPDLFKTGNTDLEACLKAVALAVLEEEK